MGTVAELEKAYGLSLSAHQKEQLHLYLQFLKRWNQRINLTSITLANEQLVLHFFEAFWAGRHFLSGAERLADVGSGAGFPGLAMKLYLPSLDVTLVEKNHKKAVFLQELSRQLDLEVRVFQGQAENYPDWQSVEVALLRALKPSSQLLQVFSGCHLKLLYFHGRQLDPWARGLQALRQAKVPQSDHRHVRLLQC